MGSFDRSKKRIQLWKKALLHFSLCFVMGLFTGFAPANTTSIFSGHGMSIRTIDVQQPGVSPPPNQPLQSAENGGNLSESLIIKKPTISSSESELPVPMVESKEVKAFTRKLLILITTATFNNPLQGALMRRLSNILNLIPPPVLWIVVEPYSDSSEVSELLRTTGIMYRHLVSKENFSDPEAEEDYQRNLVLNHIEYHRLDGVVHFAELSQFYDLQIFEQLREIETFGTWPMAKLSVNRQRVIIEGPICSSSTVIGWHLDRRSDQTSKVPLQWSNFAFNSSTLWDPERWGRTSLAQDTSQDLQDFIRQVALEDESKLRCLSSDNPKIMMWSLNLPAAKRSATMSQNETGTYY